MFVQVIQGRVGDPAKVRAALDRWAQELAPGATGWLGSTAGVTDDGQFITIARFESEEAARRNSDRPEQGEWWKGTSELFTGEVSFADNTDVDVDLNGDPDSARFVQVIQGRSSNPSRARELMLQDPEAWAAYRPDILGSLTVNRDDTSHTVVIYFSSEAEAREGERKEPPPELREQMKEMEALEVGEPAFLDLKDAWLYSPPR